MAARPKAWVCGRSLAEIAGSNPAGGVISISCECCLCQVEVSATGRSLVQRSPTECVCVFVIECDQVTQQSSTPTMRW